MGTKLAAAQIATSCGADTIIMRAEDAHNIAELVADIVASGTGEGVGTMFAASEEPARKGHTRALEGKFNVNDAVDLVDPLGETVARALVNYSSVEIARIAGHSTVELDSLLGADARAKSICTRENIAVMRRLS
ncbi:hypothetical protein FNF28_05861 [Cafeteria roenbergensis]|uniref:PUA domain-containing protein n=1 Tax=Cafeteria roenbergensis TaxID=33653 RepID=A0A5A8D3Y1_CAFRO|nr:hypothetical protein FNF28_05861 [Cafeteria roenbergensis]